MNRAEGSERGASFNTLRAVSILAVLIGHTEPFRSDTYPNDWAACAAYAYTQVTRFCIPFFFALAGYLFAKRVRAGAALGPSLWRYVKRLLFLFAIWSLIYGFWPHKGTIREHGVIGAFGAQAAKIAQTAAHEPWKLLFEGTADHLWFLTALISSIAILAAFFAVRRERYVIYLGVLLYTVGLLAGAYSPTPLGLPDEFSIGFDPRDGPFFSLLFVAVGALLVDVRSVRLSWVVGLIAGGAVLASAEGILLWHTYGSDPWNIDYVAGTVPLGVGVFLLALAKPELGGRSRVARLARYTLGLYVSHLLFLKLARSATRHVPTPGPELLTPVVLIGITWVFVWLVSKVKYLRRIVV